MLTYFFSLTANKRKRDVLEENVIESGFNRLKTCFHNKLQIFGKSVCYKDVDSLFSGEKIFFTRLLLMLLEELKIIKVQVIFSTRFCKLDQKMEYFFHTSNQPVLSPDLIGEYQEQIFEQLTCQVDQFTAKGSGLILDDVFNIEVRVANYVPYVEGCESIQILERLKKSKALISLKTHVDCFMYSILACLHPK